MSTTALLSFLTSTNFSIAMICLVAYFGISMPYLVNLKKVRKEVRFVETFLGTNFNFLQYGNAVMNVLFVLIFAPLNGIPHWILSYERCKHIFMAEILIYGASILRKVEPNQEDVVYKFFLSLDLIMARLFGTEYNSQMLSEIMQRVLTPEEVGLYQAQMTFLLWKKDQNRSKENTVKT